MLACPECRKLYPSDANECPDHRCSLVPLEKLPPQEDPLLKGGAMVGEYRIERKLGSGTFGAVYAGEQPLIGKKVAVKVLHKKFTTEPGVVSRFISEARAVNRIRHRNIIDIFSFGMLADEQPYFVMELLEGMTLGELIEREGRIELAEALPILHGIAAGLDAAHEAGITHRDLKPDNIFLAAEKGGGYFPKVLDFGVAKLVADDMAHKTATGAAIGTPSYMSPEQARGRPVDYRADIYALGVVIHEMLTGQRLFKADSAMDVLFMHVSEPPKHMSEVTPDLPRELDAPVLAMLAKSPNQRPTSAGAAVAALLDRAKADSAGEEPQADEAPVPSAFQRAMAQREAATVAIARGLVAKTPTRQTPVMEPSDATATSAGGSAATAEVSGVSGAPPPTPTMGAPAMTSDGRFVLSSKGNTIKVWDLRTGQAVYTFQGPGGVPGLPGAPSPGATAAPIAPSEVPPSSKRPAPISGKPESTAPPTSSTRQSAPSEPKRGGRARWWAIIGAGAVIVAAIAFMQKGHSPGAAPILVESASATPVRLPSRVTLHLAVTPPDAEVMLDGLHAGKASEPLVMPRSDQRRAIRFEKSGFEAQTLWVVPDRDSDLPPITLVASAPPR